VQQRQQFPGRRVQLGQHGFIKRNEQLIGVGKPELVGDGGGRRELLKQQCGEDLVLGVGARHGPGGHRVQ
jgi:hypothetical protein